MTDETRDLVAEVAALKLHNQGLRGTQTKAIAALQELRDEVKRLKAPEKSVGFIIALTNHLSSFLYDAELSDGQVKAAKKLVKKAKAFIGE